MKFINSLVIAVALSGAALSVSADTAQPQPAPKPDKLTTCPVSGDKLGEMAPPYVFVYQGQEVKLCCKSCKSDFDKDPAKYIKKIQDADKSK